MNKRRIAALLLLIALIAALPFISACGNGEKDAGGIKIVTTIFPYYDMARAITGDSSGITMLLDPGQEPHSYDPSPKDIITINECDVFIYNGGESDAWLDDVLGSLDTGVKILRVMDAVDVLNEVTTEEMTSGNEEEPDGDEYDEHIWTSPVNAIKICEAVRDAIISIDGANADMYTANCKVYTDALDALDEEFRNVVDTAKRTEIVFGDRFPLLYFVNEYGLTYYAAFPGCSSETEPSASTMAFLTDKVTNDKIPAVFKIAMSNGAVADALSDATGVPVLTFQACHNLTKDDFDAGLTYIDLMRMNVDSLKEALN